jgi:hypothetical protein
MARADDGRARSAQGGLGARADDGRGDSRRATRRAGETRRASAVRWMWDIYCYRLRVRVGM